MSSSRQFSESRAIPTRTVLINDSTQLPHDYCTTPGGTLFSTTPGGNNPPETRRVLYVPVDICSRLHGDRPVLEGGLCRPESRNHIKGSVSKPNSDSYFWGSYESLVILHVDSLVMLNLLRRLIGGGQRSCLGRQLPGLLTHSHVVQNKNSAACASLWSTWLVRSDWLTE